MTSLRQLVLEYKQNPAKIDKEIADKEQEIEVLSIMNSLELLDKKKILPLYYIQNYTVPVYDAKDVPKKNNHRYLRTLGIEEYSKMKGDIVQLFQNTINKKRFGVIINRR